MPKGFVEVWILPAQRFLMRAPVVQLSVLRVGAIAHYHRAQYQYCQEQLTATGADGFGATVPNLGAGTRLEWIPSASAFRAGFVDGTEWNSSSVGDNSVAFGNGTASGVESFAMGDVSVASGQNSFAVGQNNTASGGDSFVAGSANSTLGAYAVAFGSGNTASGNYSTALGGGTQALGDWSAWLGYRPLLKLSWGLAVSTPYRLSPTLRIRAVHSAI